MARQFNGTSDFIVFTLPSTLEAVTAGSTTIVFVANFANATDGAMVHARTSGGTNSWWMETFTEWNYGQGTTPKDVGDITTGSWAAYVGRKTTGGANAPRGRKIIFGGATTDVTAGTGLADGTPPGSGGVLQVGKWGTASEFISADVAAVAVFDSDLSDGTTATFTTWQAILDALPVWAVHFDQANAADSITDATGNGGNSSSITGTTIVANPSGFFSGATVTGTGAAVLGALTATAVGAPVHSGTAASALGGLTAAAAGLPTVNGTAAAPLGGATAIATGTRTTSGAGASSLGALAGAAAGTRTVPGVTAATLGGLTAHADAGGSVSGVGVAPFGMLVATASGGVTRFGVAVAGLAALSGGAPGTRTVFGSPSSSLGGLTAAASPGVPGLRGNAHGPPPLVVGSITVHTESIAGSVG